jgi:hypothetical protein
MSISPLKSILKTRIQTPEVPEVPEVIRRPKSFKKSFFSTLKRLSLSSDKGNLDVNDLRSSEKQKAEKRMTFEAKNIVYVKPVPSKMPINIAQKWVKKAEEAEKKEDDVYYMRRPMQKTVEGYVYMKPIPPRTSIDTKAAQDWIKRIQEWIKETEEVAKKGEYVYMKPIPT